MPKYDVKSNANINGHLCAPGEVVEVSEELAGPLVEAGVLSPNESATEAKGVDAPVAPLVSTGPTPTPPATEFPHGHNPEPLKQQPEAPAVPDAVPNGFPQRTDQPSPEQIAQDIESIE